MNANVRPPHWARWLLTRLHPEETLEEVEGDLDELYNYWYRRAGKTQATLRYLLNVLSVLPPFVRRREQEYDQPPSSLHPTMIRNYVKIALRHFNRQKGYSLIKVFGLSFGLTCCLLIALYVRYELSYDLFHAQADRIYRVVDDVAQPTGTVFEASTAGAIGPAFVSEFPEVTRAVRFKGASMLMQHGGKQFQEDAIFFTDSTVFDVFTFPLLKGNPHTALTAPSSLVLSEEAAYRYFGDADPMGKTLLIDGEAPFTVTGILQNLPANSHLQFDILLSLSTMDAGNPGWTEGWFWNTYTYVLLAPGHTATGLTNKLSSFVQRHTSTTQLKNDKQHVLSLQALTDIHLHSNRRGEPGNPGSLANVYLFSAVALFILFIACVNFVNLTTAQAAKRAKEVGLRKAMGSTRLQLAQQFLAESVLMSLVAVGLAIAFSYAVLPFFRDLVALPLAMEAFANPLGMGVIACLVVGVGVLAGGYPALLLSGFQPTRVLTGVFRASAHGNLLREGLIVFQFVISIALIVGTLTVFSQLRYMQQQNLGYKSDQTLVLYFGDDSRIQQTIEPIKDELSRIVGVAQAATSSHVPGSLPGQKQIEVETKDGVKQALEMSLIAADYDFVPLYGIKLVAGRLFSPLHGSDSTHALLINETAARQLGFRKPAEAVGKPFTMGENTGTVIGVLADFHYVSLRKRIEPLAIRMRSKSLSYLSLRLRAGAVATTMQDLERQWRKLAPHRPFDYFFLDNHFDQQYRADQQVGRMFGVAALIAILLACLGLFALVSFTVQQRSKEIGIRKVLGASVSGIVALLSQDFIKLVFIAVLIASPLAWYVMNHWLADFAYRIDMEWWVFALTGLLAIGIALLTVSFQSIKAALVNPVKSLRSE